ncbi:MAG: dienelactone hydrolase, partial [Maribacter sp.]|nr:dienelactone hydrolase [Maribacter sp.]
MKFHFKTTSHTFFVLTFLFLSLPLSAQDGFLYGDPLPDAPELSVRGEHALGVRTLEFIHKDQVDILNSKEGNDPLYDRKLTVELWYPAEVPSGTDALVSYEEVMGTRGDSLRPLIPFSFKGRALRDAKPKANKGKFPLVIVSHGYVGSRYLMTYLTENLASKGYVVVAIGHTDSTFKDAAPFQSTLLNRALDIQFVLNEMARLGKEGSNDQLSGLIDTDNTGIVGYSMGGYGVLNVAGAGYSDGLGQFFTGMTGGSTAISTLLASNPDY